MRLSESTIRANIIDSGILRNGELERNKEYTITLSNGRTYAIKTNAEAKISSANRLGESEKLLGRIGTFFSGITKTRTSDKIITTFNGSGENSITKIFGNAPFGAKNINIKVGPPSSLRPLSEPALLVSNRRNDLDREIRSARLTMRRQDATTTTITNLEQLNAAVFPGDRMVHKFVLSADDRLAIYSVPYLERFYLEEYRNISHQALATLENIEGPIKAAGMIRAEADGRFVINNSSGHFLPPPENLKYLQALMATWGAVPQIEELKLG